MRAVGPTELIILVFVIVLIFFIVRGLVRRGKRRRSPAPSIRPASSARNRTAIRSSESRIFISYRREDSAGYAGRLYDRLSEHFGADHIFMDIDALEPGEDFVTAIDNAVGSCDVFITLIGNQWLTATDAGGRRRLENPDDFVRLEIATALSRNIRVIPVLVRNASMPHSNELPQDISSLARRHALEISDSRFHDDVTRLIQAVERVSEAG